MNIHTQTRVDRAGGTSLIEFIGVAPWRRTGACAAKVRQGSRSCWSAAVAGH